MADGTSGTMTYILMSCNVPGCTGRVPLTTITRRGTARGRCPDCDTRLELDHGMLVSHGTGGRRGVLHRNHKLAS